MSAIHPDAKKNFDKKARELLDLVEKRPPEEEPEREFESERFVAAKLTEEDIPRAPDVWRTDHAGTSVARHFYANEEWYMLRGQSYAKAQGLAERIQGISNLRQQIGVEFAEDCLLGWLKNKLNPEVTDTAFVDYLLDQVNQAIDSCVVSVPVANLEVEKPFGIGNATIVPLNKAWFDSWESRLLQKSRDDEHAESIKHRFAVLRQDLQGFAAVVVEKEAERRHAQTVALQEAEEVLDMLAIFSQGIRTPDLRCGARIKGSECVRQSTCILTREEPDFVISQQINDNPAGIYWRLSEAQIGDIVKLGLGKISALLKKEKRTDFEQHALSSLKIYSKSAFTSDPTEKLVLILSSIESILIRNQSEPLQQNLGERVAVFISKELQDRKQIIRIVKEAYGLRSRYLHHGYSSKEMSVVAELMRIAWIFYLNVLGNLSRFDSRDQFVSAIDDYKLA